MYKRFSVFLLFIVISVKLAAQIVPKERDSLNYRIIGFSFPTTEKTSNYKLEIATGNYNAEDSFSDHLIRTIPSKKDRIIAEVPSFGSSYTWRAVYTDKHGKVTNGALNHFSTRTIPNVDTSLFRLRIKHRFYTQLYHLVNQLLVLLSRTLLFRGRR